MTVESIHQLFSAARVPGLIRSWQTVLGKHHLTILMYHSVGSMDGDPYAVTPAILRSQLSTIRARYDVIALDEISSAPWQKDKRSRLAVTFDDGYEDFVENALPILNEFSIPATVFVPTGFLGRSNEWDAEKGLTLHRIMDARRIRELASAPRVGFGSHSVNHLSMRGLDPKEMRREASESKRTLEDLLGRSVKSFAYPYGTLDDFSGATRDAVREAGYEIAVTSRWGTMNGTSDLFSLKRIFFKETEEAEIVARVDGDYDWFAIKERLGFWRRRFARDSECASRRALKSPAG